MPEHRSYGVLIKWNKPLLVFGIIALRMSQYAIGKLEKVPTLEYDQVSTKIVVCAVYLIFFVLALGLGIGALISGCKRITFHEGGIRCSFLFIKREIPWSSVQSWGLRGEGAWFGENKTWVLYFSLHPSTSCSHIKRYFLGRTVRVPVLYRYAGAFRRVLLPYCRTHLRGCPFRGDINW